MYSKVPSECCLVTDCPIFSTLYPAFWITCAQRPFRSAAISEGVSMSVASIVKLRCICVVVMVLLAYLLCADDVSVAR